ncbi:hypothetical protein VAS14_13044 [Photobacterium angustum S14]|uniref:Uncharacterized protein n=1 Tax=Photobacterium angustum (strain S14 / CCUG 15956) TaxID=314292 RepID=Q1ZV16_PHOAS|nr:hypothetical protein VAS14_13044 [Photobacterium angustum S14]
MFIGNSPLYSYLSDENKNKLMSE